MSYLARSLFATAVLAFGLAAAQPPDAYRPAHELLPLPEFIPGVGTLYVQPDDAPIGPWLAYGPDDILIEVLFMVPLAALEDAEDWQNLAAGTLAELDAGPVDHVDVTFNGGHPGLEEAHYHLRLVLVDDATQQQALHP